MSDFQDANSIVWTLKNVFMIEDDNRVSSIMADLGWQPYEPDIEPEPYPSYELGYN